MTFRTDSATRFDGRVPGPVAFLAPIAANDPELSGI